MRTPTTVVAADSADALTADGGIVSIRPVTDEDRPAVAALYGNASPDNLRLRFFARPSAATLTAEVNRVCRPESGAHVNVAAYEGDVLVGIASGERLGNRPRAEFAVFVDDRHHGRGIGTLLLEHLAARCRRHGITELVGEVLPANTGMLRVARGLTPQSAHRYDRGVVDVTLCTDDDRAWAAVDERDRTAERASLRALLNPASIAVVGAGHRPGGIGRETVRALLDHNYPGGLYAVNRHGAPIGPVPAFRSVHDLPTPVDLLVVAVPADQVADVLADGAKAGARGAVVLSAGFAEIGPDGAQREAGLVRLARSHGIRLIGPNCLGVLNTDPAVRLTACLAPVTPPHGTLGVAVQSGAVATTILQHAQRAGIGVSTLVALGNKADVSGNDLIAYWYDDPATHAVALHLESFGNPRRFARTVRALARRKPVLALRTGRTAAPDTVNALFAQAGVIATDTLGELLDAARMLTDQPLPAGDRLAVVSNAAGLNLLAEAFLPAPVTSVDLGGTVAPDRFAAAADHAAADADMLLLLIAGTRANRPAEILTELGCVVDRHPGLTVAAVLTGAPGLPRRLGTRGVPVFELPEQAVRALSHAAAYAAWRRRPLGGRADLAGIDRRGARAVIDRALADGPGWQSPGVTAELLFTYGIPLRPAGDTETVDLTAGLRADPLFGSVVTLARRGTRTDPSDDRALRLVPMTDLDAARMWRSLRCAPLLAGERGLPPAHTAGLEDLLLRVSRLAEDHPEIAELELDPLPAGPHAVRPGAARLRLAPPSDAPDPLLRRLRPPG
ncbi:GNAT family N-acetyltransferase [Actinoplanes lobatus]|uniref:Acyl-CoA synthetase (NDP forming)/L-amino acid N-acyltransferase YncA n=1 Tax=Actinoplanes lobatus TaxID=113568 RepID=A0A7W7HN73_9ACTN|nr:GNAT family N-acetyltransferase [Actinoplanes lobatus]MBB4753635.1 acyl-CoA synthetase (NDP forming)/L-amino acid N-acyltransferase YncA [Actinoplanes lobatus]GGN84376.1 GNAT family N-acetyltransferase [Actinoplanes lobatus]GIE38172.1 GNAT family N-acetyltransferase [Actinoplanes lobatus]